MPIDIVSRDTEDTLYVYGGIGMGDEMGRYVDPVEFIDAVRARRGKPLVVRIATVGGDPIAAAQMADELWRHDAETMTVVDGKAYSAGSMLLQGGKTRAARELSMIMVHGPMVQTGPFDGPKSESQLENEMDALSAHRTIMMQIYQRRGIARATVEYWLTSGKNHYFGAEEALEANLIDEISSESLASASEQYRIAAIFTNGSKAMSNDNSTTISAEPKSTSVQDVAAQHKNTPVRDVVAQHNEALERGMEDGRKAENARIAGIMRLQQMPAFAAAAVQSVLKACLTDIACDVPLARERAHEALAMLPESTPIAASQPMNPHGVPWQVPGGMSAGRVPGGLSIGGGHSTAAQGLQVALEIRAGVENDRSTVAKERRGNEYLSMSLVDIIAHELRAMGQPSGGTKTDIAMRYTNLVPSIAAVSHGPSQGSSHLPTVLGNIANKVAMQGWEAAGETWQSWVVQGTLTNYQPHTRGNIALLDKLKKMMEGEAFQYGKMKDVAQRITGFFHGLRYALPIQAIVNDDLSELTRSMLGWGEAAAATIGDAVFLILTEAGGGGFGQLLDEDGKPIFHADHGNLAGTGADPSEATLNAAREAMMTQQDPNNRVVGIRPRHILFGPALYATVTKLLASTELTKIEQTAGDLTIESGANAGVRGMNLNPVEEYRFVGANAKVWHLLAERRTVEVSGVEGQAVPRVDMMAQSDIPGITYTLTMPFGASALDFRGMFRNPGS